MELALSHDNIFIMSLNYVCQFSSDHLTLMAFCACSSAELRAWRWGSTTACERALQYRVGEKMHGYTVSQVRRGLARAGGGGRLPGGRGAHLTPSSCRAQQA